MLMRWHIISVSNTSLIDIAKPQKMNNGIVNNNIVIVLKINNVPCRFNSVN